MTYEEAYRIHRKRIECFCQYKLYSKSDEEAEDIASEIFILLFQKWETMDSHEGDRIKAWLYRAATLKVMESNRKAHQAPEVCEFDETRMGETEDILARDFEEDSRIFEQYLRQIKSILSRKDLILFEMKVEKKYTLAQAAESLKIKETTVRVRWFRIQKKLEKEIPEIFQEKM